MKNIHGLEFDFEKHGNCICCGKEDVPVLTGASLPTWLVDNASASLTTVFQELNVGICEFCTTTFAWAWRHEKGDALQPAFDETPWASVVLLPQNRPDDYQIPYNVLMTGRKDDPGAFGLPGGKRESYRESPADTAVRELQEETGVVTWPWALDLIYTGYDPRVRLVNVYACRAYAVPLEGIPSEREGLPVVWKLWPVAQYAGFRRGFYLGIEEAFRCYEQLRLGSQTDTINRRALSVELCPAAAKMLEAQTAPTPQGGATRGYVAALKAECSLEEIQTVELMVMRHAAWVAGERAKTVDRSSSAMQEKKEETESSAEDKNG